MAKYLEIQIPTPCHEKWDNMHSSTNGRFCDACQKTVVDFSPMTDSQLINFFKKNTANVCGRFNQDQLESGIPLPVKKIPWLTYFFRITIPAFLFSYKASAERVRNLHKIVNVMVKKKALEPRPADSSRLVTGKITDENGKPISYATVLIVGSKQGVMADVYGGFSIKLRHSESLLEISSLEYEKRLITVGPSDNQLNVILKNLGARMMIGEVVVRSTVRRTNKKINKDVPKTPAISPANTITVFPNPVKAFSPLTIRWKEPVYDNQEIGFYNISGKLVNTQVIQINSSTSEIQLNTEINTPGYYILRVTDSKTYKALVAEIVIE